MKNQPHCFTCGAAASSPFYNYTATLFTSQVLKGVLAHRRSILDKTLDIELHVHGWEGVYIRKWFCIPEKGQNHINSLTLQTLKDSQSQADTQTLPSISSVSVSSNSFNPQSHWQFQTFSILYVKAEADSAISHHKQHIPQDIKSHDSSKGIWRGGV